MKSATSSRLGAGTWNWRSTRSGARSAPGAGMVVRTLFWRRTPCQPLARINRSTVDLATGIPSRCRWAHIFTDPYSDSGFFRPFSSGS